MSEYFVSVLSTVVCHQLSMFLLASSTSLSSRLPTILNLPDFPELPTFPEFSTVHKVTAVYVHVLFAYFPGGCTVSYLTIPMTYLLDVRLRLECNDINLLI